MPNKESTALLVYPYVDHLGFCFLSLFRYPGFKFLNAAAAPLGFRAFRLFIGDWDFRGLRFADQENYGLGSRVSDLGCFGDFCACG